MTVRTALRRALWLAIRGAIFGTLLPFASRVAAQPTDPFAANRFYGAGTCKQCHTMPMANNKPDFVKLNEYTVWRTQDHHSSAYAMLESPRSQEMGRLLGSDPKFVLRPEAGCLHCHSMHFPGREGDQFSLKDGISCDGCHGPSEQWIGPHAFDKTNWRKLSDEAKEQKGMRALRDPRKKTALCASCHVGSAAEGKVITHAMYAAGHPPLPPFEVATFCQNLPKHWYSTKDVHYLKQAPPEIQERYHWSQAPIEETRLALIGGAITAATEMELLADRANVRDGDRKQVWPELAMPALKGITDAGVLWPQIAMGHSDCASCHHDLRTPTWRQERRSRVAVGGAPLPPLRPGRPQLDLPSLILADLGRRSGGPALQAPNAAPAEWLGDLERLYRAWDERPFGPPEGVRSAAQAVAARIRAAAGAKPFDQLTVAELPRLLQRLAAVDTGNPDFATARQTVAVLQVAATEWATAGRAGNAENIRPALQALAAAVNLHGAGLPDELAQQRFGAALAQLEKLSGRKLGSENQLAVALLSADVEPLREALSVPELLEAFDKIRDTALAQGLQQLGAYDPTAFKAGLERVASMLPKE